MPINIDLSKALHPRLLDVLIAFMPGFFFEICMLVANPALVTSFAKPPIDRPPVAIVTAVLVAFFVGNVFVIWVSFVQRILFWAVRGSELIFDPLWKKLLQYLMRARGNPPRPSRFARSMIVNRAYRRVWERDLRFQKVGRNWQHVAERILKLYKVELPEDGDSWTAWMGIIGRFKIQDFRGPIMLVGTVATGWSGLAAMYFAPRLNTRYFLAFCFFSIGIGLLEGLRIASNLANPEHSWQLGTLRAFEELKAIVGREVAVDDGPGEED